MLLKIFLIFAAFFSANAIDYEMGYLCSVGSPVGSQTMRKTVEQYADPQSQVDNKKLVECTQTIPICGPRGGVIGVYEYSLCSQENISELEKLQKSLKTDMIFYNSHAIANTILLGGAFYSSPEISAVSTLYMGCCAIVYGAFSINSNIKCAESQNSTEQNVLSTLFYFQRRQSCLNMLAAASFMEGEFLEVPVLGYTLGGLALVAAVGNSLFFACAS